MEKLGQDLKQRFFSFTATFKSFGSTKGYGDENEPRLRPMKVQRTQVYEETEVEEMVIQVRAVQGAKSPGGFTSETPPTH